MSLALPLALDAGEPGRTPTPAVAGTAGCLHCGAALDAQALQIEIDGRPASVCCHGCASAARWIREAGLGDWFALRQVQGPKGQQEIEDYTAWAHPEVLAAHAHGVPGGLELTLLTDGLRCAACAWLVDRALAQVPGVLEVSANAITGRIRLAWDPARAALPELLSRLARLGFAPQLATGQQAEDARRRARRTGLLQLGWAALGALQTMMFAEAAWLDAAGQMPLATRDVLRWITMLVSTPVVFWSGASFLAGMRREWRARRAGMDTLVSVSLLLAYGASVVETVRGGPQVWFDAAVMFVFLLLLARQLEAWARLRAGARVDLLAHAQPALARREAADGRIESIPAVQLRVGDVVQVAAGAALPADGVLLDSAASVDVSLLTGEALAVERQPGQALLAGSVCGWRPLRMQVRAVAGASRLAQLLRLVERAQSQRPRIARMADRVAAWCVPAMLLLAAGVGLVWTLVDPSRAMPATLAVLAVTCPCALSLAVPAALAVAIGALARRGVLVVDSDALPALASCDYVLCDKTGTLTAGQPDIAELHPVADTDPAAALALVAALQRGSGHALAAAFASCGLPSCVAHDVVVVPGAGVEGGVGGERYRLGRADFCGVGADDDDGVWLARRHGVRWLPMLRCELRDLPRPQAAAAVRALEALGLRVELSSGDAPTAVARLADALGLRHWRARQSPEAKLDRLRVLQAGGHRVLMVGDGSNDAPVLAGAHVAVAMGTGTALAQQAAGMVIPGAALERLPPAIRLARRTRRILRQNLGWAVAYNVLAIPPAALGWVSPWMAALGMALSSLLVTLNALRLQRDPLLPESSP